MATKYGMRARKYKAVCKRTNEDQNGRKKWEAIKKSIAAFDLQLNARDDKEEARAGNLDRRLNHWTAVRDALMNAHADLFRNTRDRENNSQARSIK